MSERRWWWLAINGDSVAASPTAERVTDLSVVPTPQLLVGVQSHEEQIRLQRFMLTAPIEDVYGCMRRLPEMVNRAEVLVVSFARPEPPTRGPTLWTHAPDVGEDGDGLVEGAHRLAALKALLAERTQVEAGDSAEVPRRRRPSAAWPAVEMLGQASKFDVPHSSAKVCKRKKGSKRR